ncbi:MAG: hypothetical protein Q4F31_09870 [Eubacteriales bacterium]|nr:hypothetical protein [Eubacteriales bacterium]
MNKYIITNSVRFSELKNMEHSAATISGNSVFRAEVPELLKAAAGGIPALGVYAIKYMADNAVIKIHSAAELISYKNALPTDWKKNTLYIEHPLCRKVLIEASVYKDYILREMVADITNYVADHLDLQKYVIGLVASNHHRADACINVKDIDAEASMNIQLNKNYFMALQDSHANENPERDYIWISRFPDIISAVEHKSGRMEVVKKIALDLDANVGMMKKMNAGIKAEKQYEFYIKYVRAE